jgi:4-amino-4-deoxy-L-arabinose transferase-like glycosyltransferase
LHFLLKEVRDLILNTRFNSTFYGVVTLFLACILILFLYNLGSYPLFDPDEPRYAEASRQIALYGDWITPHFNGLIRLEKPPFFYWLAALSYKAFGISEWSARFPSAILASLTVIFSSLLVSWRNGWLKGILSGLILASSILFLGIGRMSITDMTLTAWLTGAGFSLYLVTHHHRRWWLAAGIFIGLALLTKGPIGLAIPLMVIGLYSLWTKQFRKIFLTPWMPIGLTLSFIIALPWYILAYQANGDFFLQSLFWNNVTRYSSVVSGHKQPGWYYIDVLLIGFMPWTFFLPAAALRIANREFWVSPFKSINDESRSLLRYCVLWASFVFAFFMLGQTRLPTYILPMFPPLAIAFALLVPTADSENITQNPLVERIPLSISFKAWILGSIASCLISLIGSLILITQYSKLLHFNPTQAESSFIWIVIIAVSFMLFNLIALIFFIKRKAVAAIAVSISGIIVMNVGLWGHVIPLIATNAQAETMRFIQKVGPAPLAVYDLQRPSLTYYGKRNFPRFSSLEENRLIQWIQKQATKSSSSSVSRIDEMASDTRREHRRSASVGQATCANEKHSNKVDDCHIINYGNADIFAYIILRPHRIPTVQARLEKLYPNAIVKINRIETSSKYNLVSASLQTK